MADPGGQCRELWSPLQQELWVFFYFLSNTKTYKMTECKAECNEIILSCHEFTILLYILSNLCWGFELIGALGSFHKLSHWKLFDFKLLFVCMGRHWFWKDILELKTANLEYQGKLCKKAPLVTQVLCMTLRLHCWVRSTILYILFSVMFSSSPVIILFFCELQKNLRISL